MSPKQPITVADVLHRMYAASEDPFSFPDTLAGLLEMHVSGLAALYDQPAPDPWSPDFDDRVAAIAGAVGCAPDLLAELLLRWTPRGGPRAAPGELWGPPAHPAPGG